MRKCTRTCLKKERERKTILEPNISTPDRDFNLDLPVIGSLAYFKSSTLDHVATKADIRTLWTEQAVLGNVYTVDKLSKTFSSIDTVKIMDSFWALVPLLLVLTLSTVNCYRLPKNVLPEKYTLEIITSLGDNGQNFSFDGKVRIHMYPKEVFSVTNGEGDEAGKNLVNGTHYVKKVNFFVIELSEKLVAGNRYVGVHPLQRRPHPGVGRVLQEQLSGPAHRGDQNSSCDHVSAFLLFLENAGIHSKAKFWS
uniref:(California timema) hypothetical protein n=1 Tax=Timema californicum TaxID=61474 RepID=A0A7R9JC00_TIMCA|nr:unnamed protein product [Timema californicum]